MKNEFKKSYSDKKVDSEGNKLTEDIREVTNEEHKDKVLKARENKNDYIRFRCTTQEKIDFKLACDGEKFSKVARSLFIAYTKGQIKIN